MHNAIETAFTLRLFISSIHFNPLPFLSLSFSLFLSTSFVSLSQFSLAVYAKWHLRRRTSEIKVFSYFHPTLDSIFHIIHAQMFLLFVHITRFTLKISPVHRERRDMAWARDGISKRAKNNKNKKQQIARNVFWVTVCVRYHVRCCRAYLCLFFPSSTEDCFYFRSIFVLLVCWLQIVLISIATGTLYWIPSIAV